MLQFKLNLNKLMISLLLLLSSSLFSAQSSSCTLSSDSDSQEITAFYGSYPDHTLEVNLGYQFAPRDEATFHEINKEHELITQSSERINTIDRELKRTKPKSKKYYELQKEKHTLLRDINFLKLNALEFDLAKHSELLEENPHPDFKEGQWVVGKLPKPCNTSSYEGDFFEARKLSVFHAKIKFKRAKLEDEASYYQLISENFPEDYCTLLKEKNKKIDEILDFIEDFSRKHFKTLNQIKQNGSPLSINKPEQRLMFRDLVILYHRSMLKIIEHNKIIAQIPKKQANQHTQFIKGRKFNLSNFSIEDRTYGDGHFEFKKTTIKNFGSDLKGCQEMFIKESAKLLGLEPKSK